MPAKTHWDYIVIGAGSAGCVLASRLSQAHRVLLLEAGGGDADPRLRMPAAFSMPMGNPRFDWCYASEREAALGGRRLDCPRGRVLGGSSSINGMVYVRGHPRDFDGWGEAGAPGWSWSTVAPVYRRLEDCRAPVDPAHRGTAGPLAVTRGDTRGPLQAAFLAAGQEAGHALSVDLNGAEPEGVGAFERTIADGVRMSAARAFLAPARRRASLRVETGALVDRIEFDGCRARQVRYRLHGGERVACAAAEILMAAGAIGSPLLLQRSGIGPAALLREHGVPVRCDLPGVGENLMDHLEAYVQYACRLPITLNGLLPLHRRLGVGLRWFLTRSGPGASNHFDVGGFLRSTASAPWPDLQLHFLPGALNYDGSAPQAGHGFQIHTGPMLPQSRGHVRLRGRDPALPPEIVFNYQREAADRATFRRAIRLVRTLVSQPAFDDLRGIELAPGPYCVSDADLDAFVARRAESAYHPCGTCRMGLDVGAVVDGDCLVHGVDGLRVVDASVFPRITNGNLNGPTMMVALRIADALLHG